MIVSVLLLALILSVAASADTAAKTKYDVYLLIGQSNMAGRGTLTVEDMNESMDGVYLLGEDGAPVPATHPLNQYSTIRKDIRMQGMNPGYGFAKVIKAASERPILLVCNAKGGTSILQWEKGAEDAFYDEAVSRCKMAMKYGKLKGIIWHQGCSDAEPGRTKEYMSHLRLFVKNLRKDLKAGRKVPFIAGELARWLPYAEEFNAVINTISENIPNSASVSSEGCSMLSNEKDPHFGREGQILLGERYGHKMLEILHK